MNIGIDVRSFQLEYPLVLKKLILSLNDYKSNNKYHFYLNTDLGINIDNKNIILENIQIKPLSIQEQTIYLQKLLKDKNDLMIFFEETSPLFYKGESIQIIPSLKNIFFPELLSSKPFKKYSLIFLFKNLLKKSNKILCFDKKTAKNINEKLNINDNKINTIKPFFWDSPSINSNINPKQKHSINGDYIIYDNNIGTNKNIKKLIEVLKEIQKENNIHLVCIGDKISKDLEIRELIISLGLTKKIHFVGTPSDDELGIYYKNSLGVVMPSLYESFPFSLSNAINYQINILCSDLDENKDIFNDKVIYFKTTSKIDLLEKINILIKNKKTPDYNSIINKYNAGNFLDTLHHYISKNG